MAICNIIQLDLEKEYQPEIKGLGEIYEKISVLNLQKKLKKKFQKGILFLSSNKQHRGGGLTLEELQSYVKKRGYKILEFGFVDSPPWASKQKKIAERDLENSWWVNLTKLLFWFLVKLEFIWQGKKNSHMVFCLGKN